MPPAQPNRTPSNAALGARPHSDTPDGGTEPAVLPDRLIEAVTVFPRLELACLIGLIAWLLL